MPIQLDNTNTGSATLKGPSSSTSSLVFPSATGTSNQALITNGSGVLSWASVTSPAIAGFTTDSANRSMSASGGTTNQGAAIVPKGSGGFCVNLPDATSTGGNARGLSSVDLQAARSSASSVASGLRAIILGGTSNTASGTDSIISGSSNTAATTGAINLGGSKASISSGGTGAIVFGQSPASTFSFSTSGSSLTVLGPVRSTTANVSLSTFYATFLPRLVSTNNGQHIYGSLAYANTCTATAGEVQIGGVTSSGSTTAELTSDAAAGASTNRVYCGTIGYVFGNLVARSSTGLSKIWSFSCAGSSTAGTNSPATSFSVVYSDTGTSSWSISATNTSGYWVFSAQGDASLTVRWFARVQYVL